VDRRHIISGLFWLAISIFVCKTAIQLGVGTFASPGSGLFSLVKSDSRSTVSNSHHQKHFGKKGSKAINRFMEGFKMGQGCFGYHHNPFICLNFN